MLRFMFFPGRRNQVYWLVVHGKKVCGKEFIIRQITKQEYF